MARGVSISPEVQAVLERSVVEGNIVTLPEGQLDRALYASVDKVLKALGGKWDRRAGGHIFAAGVGGELADALGSGFAVDQKKTAEQFFTPPAVAALMFERALLHSDAHVMEPSAGMGALLAEPLRLGCFITAVERDENLAIGLRGLIGRYHGCGVWHADFLAWEPVAKAPIDRVLMNPPFSRGQDMAHVERAFSFLRPGGILVAVMSPHWTFGTDRQSEAFRQFAASHVQHWEALPEASFRSSGTGVGTGLLTLRKAEQ
jgi:predicted RNA methylase